MDKKMDWKSLMVNMNQVMMKPDVTKVEHCMIGKQTIITFSNNKQHIFDHTKDTLETPDIVFTQFVEFYDEIRRRKT